MEQPGNNEPVNNQMAGININSNMNIMIESPEPVIPSARAPANSTRHMNNSNSNPPQSQLFPQSAEPAQISTAAEEARKMEEQKIAELRRVKKQADEAEARRKMQAKHEED